MKVTRASEVCELENEFAEKANQLCAQLGQRFRIAIVLGSGLSAVANIMGLSAVADYAEMGLPPTTVAGHGGRVCAGRVGTVPVLAFQGRSHLYEGRSLEEVTRWIRLARAAGCDVFVLTNAAGGLKTGFQVGDLMAIKDHISLPGLCGYGDAVRPSGTGYPWPRFVHQNTIYDGKLSQTLAKAGQEIDIAVESGTYAMVWGPAYESPAEQQLLHLLGADAVGMSTIPEALLASSLGVKVLGLSLITNVAHSPTPPTHEEVTAASEKACERISRLLVAFISGRLAA